MAVTILCGLVSVTDTAIAATPVPVDFTVRESLPAAIPGVMIASNLPGCPTATVATVDASRTDIGPVAIFRGRKIFDCGGGDTFTLRFRALSIGCSSIDVGTWRLNGGTGAYAGATGFGLLVGSYRLGGGPGTACLSDGIDDHYTGRLRLAP